MNGRRILAAVFLLTALGAGYLAIVLWRAEDPGKWLFLVFTVFFLGLLLVPLLPGLKPKPAPPAPTRFVSVVTDPSLSSFPPQLRSPGPMDIHRLAIRRTRHAPRPGPSGPRLSPLVGLIRHQPGLARCPTPAAAGIVRAMILLASTAFPASAAPLEPLPREVRVVVEAGKAADRRKDYPAAMDHFLQALDAAPGSPEVLFSLGVVESKITGRELRAIAWFAAYLSLRPDGPDTVAVQNEITRLKLASHATLLQVIKLVEANARFAERPGPSLRDVARDLAQLGEFTAALQIAENLKPLPESQAEAYAAIALVHSERGDFDEALRLIDFIPGGPATKSDALVQIVKRLFAKDRPRAQAIAEEIADPMIRDRVRRHQSYQQVWVGDLTGALRSADSIQDEETRGSARHDIAFRLVETGDIAGALKLATVIPPWVDQGAALDQISLTQAKNGDFAGAIQSQSLNRGGNRVHVLTRIAQLQAESGNFAGAFATVELVEKTENNVGTRSVVQASIARFQQQRGVAEGAQRSLATAQRLAALIPDASHRDSALRSIARIRAELGDLTGAIRAAELIGSVYWKSQTKSEIASERAKAGAVEDAITAARTIRESERDMLNNALSTIANIQVERGDVTGALQTADLISSSAKDGTLRLIAEKQARSGDPAGASQTTGLIQDASNRRTAQKSVDRAFVTSGNALVVWRRLLENVDPDDDCPLGAAPFLNLPGHLRTLSTSGDPKKMFSGLYRTYYERVDAEETVSGLFNLQTGGK